MKTQKRTIGDFGERLAGEYLTRNGYLVIGKNYLIKFGEIDIIAQEGDIFVFVEVKTTFSDSNILPEENITLYKMKRLLRTIEIYCMQNKIDKEWRLDSISVTLNKETNRATIRHIRNININ